MFQSFQNKFPITTTGFRVRERASLLSRILLISHCHNRSLVVIVIVSKMEERATTHVAADRVEARPAGRDPIGRFTRG